MVETIDAKDLTKAREIAAKYKGMPGNMMPVLQEVQEAYGFLDFAIQEAIADELEIPMSEVYGVVTFYSQFSLERKGDYKVGLCMGTACYVKNAQEILDELADVIDVEVGGTTEDYKFTLEATRCLGCCGLAPVMMINDDVYGGLEVADIKGIIEKY